MEDCLVNTLDDGRRIAFSAFVSTLMAITAAAPMTLAQGAPKVTPLTASKTAGSDVMARVLSSRPNLHFSKGIPVNFPVPAYTSNVVRTNFVNSLKGPPRATASIMTRDRPDQVFQWYLDNCKKTNWILKVPTDQFLQQMRKKVNIYMMTGQKDKEEVQIFCTENKRPAGTTVNIMWTKKS